MVRKVMRLPAVLAATGWAKPTLYVKIAAGKFPKGTKLDPDARAVVWFEDQIEAFQKAAVAAAMEAA
jgi:predicted DNA-binding transcriptional regulator AlpA